MRSQHTLSTITKNTRRYYTAQEFSLVIPRPQCNEKQEVLFESIFFSFKFHFLFFNEQTFLKYKIFVAKFRFNFYVNFCDFSINKIITEKDKKKLFFRFSYRAGDIISFNYFVFR